MLNLILGSIFLPCNISIYVTLKYSESMKQIEVVVVSSSKYISTKLFFDKLKLKVFLGLTCIASRPSDYCNPNWFFLFSLSTKHAIPLSDLCSSEVWRLETQWSHVSAVTLALTVSTDVSTEYRWEWRCPPPPPFPSRHEGVIKWKQLTPACQYVSCSVW